MVASSFASLSPKLTFYEFVGENPSPTDPDDICFRWAVDSDESSGFVDVEIMVFFKNGTFAFEESQSLLEGDVPKVDCASAYSDPSQEVPIENITDLDIEIFLYNEERDKSFQYPRVDIVQGPLSFFNDTCEIKYDYTPGILCSNSNIVVNDDSELEDYLQNFGFDGVNFQNLKVAYDISNSNIQLHSPCRIILKNGIKLDGDLVCIDGRTGVSNSNGFELSGTDSFIFSEEGSIKLGKNSDINVSTLYMQAPNKVRIARESNVSVVNILTLNSTGSNSSSNVRINRNSIVNTDKLFMSAFRKVVIANSTQISALRDVSLETRGNLSKSNVKINKETQINADILSIKSGNKIIFGRGSILNINSIEFNN